jgi:hypothetical protein
MDLGRGEADEGMEKHFRKKKDDLQTIKAE